MLAEYPCLLAKLYHDQAQRIAGSDPDQAKALKDATEILRTVPNSRKITMPAATAPATEITAAVKQYDRGRGISR
jgi:hypothetical protein